MAIGTQLVLFYGALLILSVLFDESSSADVLTDLSDDLDKFLEILFDKSECEDFLSDSDWVSVATRSCTPVECDFPRQLCMRPSGKFNDESTNQCRNIPETCITAANNGVPLGTSAPKLVPSTTTPMIPSLILTIATKPPLPIPEPSPLLPPITIPSTVEVTALPIGPVLPETFGTNICELGLPQGRFCGFLEKFTYNREYGRCEKFLFAGCTTPETNANLFDTIEECFYATRSCTGLRPRTHAPVIPSPAPHVFPPPRARPPPPIQPPPVHPPPVIQPPFPQPGPTEPFIPTPPPLPPDERPSSNSQSPFFNLISGFVGATNGGGGGNGGDASTNEALLGLISNGIQQFTGMGTGFGGGGQPFMNGFNLAQIPDWIRTFQTMTGRR